MSILRMPFSVTCNQFIISWPKPDISLSNPLPLHGKVWLTSNQYSKGSRIYVILCMWSHCVNTVTSVLLRTLSLAGSEKASCRVVSCLGRWPRDKELSAGPSHQNTEAPNLTTCKKLNSTNNHMSLERDPSPVEPQIKPKLLQWCRRPS